MEIRDSGRPLFGRCVKESLTASLPIHHAAQRLGIRSAGKVLVLRSEFESNLFQEYLFFEFRHEGRTLAEVARDRVTDLSPLEADILAAWQHSRTSLFEVTGVNPGKQTLELRDLLEPDRPNISLTDIQLSQNSMSVLADLVLFTRVFEVRGIFMTNGNVMVFPKARLAGLLDSTRQRLKRTPPGEQAETRFIHFTTKGREFGILAETEPSPRTAS